MPGRRQILSQCRAAHKGRARYVRICRREYKNERDVCDYLYQLSAELYAGVFALQDYFLFRETERRENMECGRLFLQQQKVENKNIFTITVLI